MIKRSKKKNGNKQGFTLVETLVAAAILILAVAGPLVVVGRSLQGHNSAINQTTAEYLAQEAIEIVRNRRDQNLISLSKSSSVPASSIPPRPWWWPWHLPWPPPWWSPPSPPSGSTDWLDGLNPCFEPNVCRVQATDTTFLSGNTTPLSLNGDVYGYSGGTVTPFQRTVRVRPTGLANERLVEVTVEWELVPGTGRKGTFVAQEYIYNWINF